MLKKSIFGPFKIMNFKVAVQFVESVIMDSEGIMMHQEFYIAEASTNVALGRLTYIQGSAQWAQWVSELGQPGCMLVTDQKGPPHSRLRIRVATVDKVIYRSQVTISRDVELLVNSIKRPHMTAVQATLNKARSNTEIQQLKDNAGLGDVSTYAKDFAAASVGVDESGNFTSNFADGSIADVRSLVEMCEENQDHLIS